MELRNCATSCASTRTMPTLQKRCTSLLTKQELILETELRIKLVTDTGSSDKAACDELRPQFQRVFKTIVLTF
jgi:hypothetical protein